MRLQRWFYTLPLRLRSVFRRGQVEQELDEELRYHLEQQIEENLASGMTVTEARHAALRAMGGIEQQKERCRDMRRVSFVEDLARDLRYGLRVLAKSPVFTAVAMLTLALGIGANTAIFSVVNELLLRPLPFRDAERLVMLWENNPNIDAGQNPTSRANFRAWREQSNSFESMAAFSDQRLNLTGDGEPEEVSVQLATPELFHVLGVEPILGRGLTQEDGLAGAPRVAVLSYGIWQRRFGGDAGVVGRPITLNGAPFTVIGVLPAGFQWHIKRSSNSGRPAEIWTVLPMPTEGPSTRGRFLSAVARLKPGVSLEQALAEMKTIAARLEQDSQYNNGYTAQVIPLREQFVGNIRPALLILLGAVGFVLLIACANVANLLLARAAAREKEIALRTALGAGRMRIVRQLLTESLLLALMGSILGLGVAWMGIRVLVSISPRDVVNLQGFSINITVLAWTMAISLLTGIIFGLAPALEATRLNLNDALKEGGKGAGGQSSRSRRLRSALVVGEVALALVLLASAGLMVRSFAHLRKIDTGFNADNVLTMVVRLPAGKYREDYQVVGFFRQVIERIRALPGVRSVGMVNYLPFYGGLGASSAFTIEGRPAQPPGQWITTDVRVADPGYFDVMGVPLLRGRNFTDLEASEARHVALVSEAMVRQHFRDEDPIGKRITVPMSEKPAPTEIIGIVGDVKYESLVDEAKPAVYLPHAELTYSFMTLVIRTTGDPAEMAPALRSEVRGIDPEQPVSDVRTMSQVMADTLGRARFNTLLLGLFAGLATLLAAVGIFGVMNYSVTLRTHEIGIRVALGAQEGRVLMLILRQGLLLTLIGIGIGLGGALALTRLLSGLLFGVGATDPITFAAIVLLLALVSLIACYIPARRATRVDPMTALRHE
ncbi:MAG: ADOP family duplicated permease [Blastocatellia bacterium]